MEQRKLRGDGVKKLNSGRYQISYRDAEGVRCRQSFDRKKEAEAALDEIRSKIRRGEYVNPKSIPTFAEMAATWIQGKQFNAGKSGKPLKQSTLDHWQNHLDRSLLPTLGKRRMDTITTEFIETQRFEWQEFEWQEVQSEDSTTWEKKKRKIPLSPASVNKLLTTATAIFDEAIRMGKINKNPAKLAKRLGIGSNEVSDSSSLQRDGDALVDEKHVYTPEELGRLFASAKPGFARAFLMTVALTGIRHGEALALQWGDVDRKAGKLIIRRNWPSLYTPDGEPIFYTPKSRKSCRELPLPDELLLELLKWRELCPKSKWDLIFPKPDGRPQDRKSVIRGSYLPAIESAGLKRLDIHALRHTFASILLSQGAPITEVSAYLGHANPQITLTVYSHWMPKKRTDSVSKLAGSIFSDPRAESEAQEAKGGVHDTAESRGGHHKDTLEVVTIDTEGDKVIN